VFALIY